MGLFDFEIYNSANDTLEMDLAERAKILEGKYKFYFKNSIGVSTLPFEAPIDLPVYFVPVTLYDYEVNPEHIIIYIDVGETNPVPLALIAVVAGLGILMGGIYLVLDKVERILEPKIIIPIIVIVLIVFFIALKVWKK